MATVNVCDICEQRVRGDAQVNVGEFKIVVTAERSVRDGPNGYKGIPIDICLDCAVNACLGKYWDAASRSWKGGQKREGTQE